jgi:hypothetical protein
VIRVGEFPADEWRHAASEFIRWHRRKLTKDPQRAYFDDAAWPAARLSPPGELRAPFAESYAVAPLRLIRRLREIAEEI